MTEKIKIGVSSCLLGNPVRWNGGHSRDPFLIHTLGMFVEYTPVCPEVECGLGVPRETLRLTGEPESPRLVTTRTGVDHTHRMSAWADSRLKELEPLDLCGFIFKNGSPSSGLMRVKVYNSSGMPRKIGVGIFARMFTERFPRIPVEEDGRLHDPGIRENFIESIFVLKQWREVASGKRTVGKLVEFHTAMKLLIMSHSIDHYRRMGKLTADGKAYEINELYDQYESLLIEALRLKTTIKKNVNVLQHLMGYFKKELSADEKQELLEVFDHYRNGHTPLIAPLTLINHYVRKYDQPYLKQQTYLNPHPLSLKLRNHA